MAESTFGIQDMIDRVAAGLGRQALSRDAELVVDVQASMEQGTRPLSGDLDQLVDRLQALGHAALAQAPARGSVLLTIREGSKAPPPTLAMPRSRLLHFNMQATGAAGGEPAGAPYFFEQVFAAGAPVPAPSSREVAGASLQSRRVLAVDDNQDALRVLLQLGRPLGLEVACAHDAGGALRAVSLAHQSAHGFDLVLLDARLPPHDALACARRLRESPCVAPILLMAGPGDDEAVSLLSSDQALGRELGVVGVLRKPLVDGQALARACLAALRRPLRLPPRADPASPFSLPLPTMTIPAAKASAPLPALPGIDTAIGRASTMNNDKLYRRLLIKFRDAQQGATAQVAQAWEAGDSVLARRLAHDLASVSGTLGAMRLHDVARRLEAICAGEADAAGLPESLALTGDELARVLDGLQVLGAE